MSDQPVANLVTPEKSDPIPDLVELVINGNGVSLSYRINYLIMTLTSFDLLALITNDLAGDWSELQKSGQAVANLAQYNKDLASTIEVATAVMRNGWEGNAADNAGEYFSTLATTLSAQVETLNGISDEIAKCASASYNLAALAAGAVQEAIDISVVILALIAASIASKSSVVAAPASLGVDAVIAAQVVRLGLAIYKIVGFLSKIFTTVQAAAGFVEALQADIDFTKLIELPESGYKHAGVSV
ncbi:hypothetical protein [Nocardia lasii]|uniref:WXG100 family type VII secretion target n=1 Tax=Nocardia lasii TaxID=1616107 RepID=A0ABW1JQ83_9NOCA